MDEREVKPEPTDAPPDDAGTFDGDPIDVAWKRLTDRWDDDDAHTKLLSVGAADARLGEVVALYRRVAEDGERSESDRAIAKKKMDNAAFLAVQMMEATKTRKRDVPRLRPGVVVAAFVTIALGGLLIWAATHQ